MGRKGINVRKGCLRGAGRHRRGKKNGRESDEEKILCIPIDMASEDITASYRVYQIAKEKGLDQKLRWL